MRVTCAVCHSDSVSYCLSALPDTARHTCSTACRLRLWGGDCNFAGCLVRLSVCFASPRTSARVSAQLVRVLSTHTLP
eukprot:jgi/Chrzof1/12744/Cz07g05290.t1